MDWTIFKGMKNDIRLRLPYYRSDWTDAWNYRVIPATVYIFFTNLLPALAFSFDLYERTQHSFGVNEILLSTALSAVIFSLFSGQPLTIIGVTGPISVFNYTIYRIVEPMGVPYYPFTAWVYLWSMLMHFLIAMFNCVYALKYITRFSCDVFGIYNAILYIQKGAEVISHVFSYQQNQHVLGFSGVVLALMTGGFGYLGFLIGEKSPLFNNPVRQFLADYSTPMVVIFFTGFAHIGLFRQFKIPTLPKTRAFYPTLYPENEDVWGTEYHRIVWFVKFWEIKVGYVFLAIPFAILLTILFYFDHNVSSLMAQDSVFRLKKPGGFHWDFFLLGVVTGICGILGLPAPNGLIPQAPLHTERLAIIKLRPKEPEVDKMTPHEAYISGVVEQRVSNLGQGLLTLGCMAGPLLTVIGLVPQPVIAGLFWVMGLRTFTVNGVVHKMYVLLTDPHMVEFEDELTQLPRKVLAAFVAWELFSFGATFAMTSTIAAVGFPILLVGFAALAAFVLPRIFSKEHIEILDEPTADEFTMASALILDARDLEPRD
ncbi:hypothetical protein CANCADRAFT_27888 [Tortispora caseinolytica NRRL Y-17796]|uniref:Bicarbonate transporter-like transmembrane domain-containing protein n=1 Tax=Tortispora caseinolytica NRRL Y-17796 TaxID=767744 RepID=A0A1E4TCU7_9ASCO|nr:hypothetical protein CANCADRAFT_27888 [Tortispora caseinolytica NRRL Y-17796]